MPNYTIYISTTNDRHFQSEENKGGLINELLELHYGSNYPGSDSTRGEILSTKDKQERLDKQVQEKVDHVAKQLRGEESNYVPDRTIEGVVAPDKTRPSKTPKKAVSRSEAKRIAIVSGESTAVTGTVEAPITDRNREMKFCKHGAVVGFCKKGCK